MEVKEYKEEEYRTIFGVEKKLLMQWLKLQKTDMK